MESDVAMTEPPSFKGFLYWFVVILCTFNAAVFAAGYISGHLLAYFGLFDLYFVKIVELERPALAIGFGCSIILAGLIARRHGLTFWPTVGGYLLGEVIATLLMMPLSAAVSALTTRFAFPTGLLLALVILAAYGIACGAAITIGRRRRKRRRQQRRLANVF
jgi:hypothetical protein